MVVYGIANCNTVKKAQDWLKSNQIDFEFHDFKKKGITAEKLTEWFKVFGWEKVINRNGLTFKKLSKDEQAAINSPEAAISYLMQNTSAIKRPIVEQDGKAILLGFTEESYQAQLHSKG
jgi:arsenate reductase